MKQSQNAWRVVFGVSALLFVAGCNTGGGGLFGFFGGNSGSSSSDVIGSVATGGTLNLASVTQDVATVHNPEPASLTLFGGGLALAAWRRRRTRRVMRRQKVT